MKRRSQANARALDRPLAPLLFLALSLSGNTFSATYHVAQNAAGSGDGRSYANRMSVAKQNRTSFKPGNIICFSGTITSEIIVPSSGSASGGYVTYDGYQAGSYDAWSEESGKVAKVSRTEAKGVKGITLANVNHVIIQDFELEKCGTAISGRKVDHVIVRRCFIHDMFQTGTAFSSSSNITVGGAPGDGIVVRDAGTNTADEDVGSASVNGMTVSYCRLYATKANGTPDDRGIDGICLNWSYNILIEHNEIFNHQDNYGDDARGEDGIDIKKPNAGNGIIRYNRIYGNRQSGITMNSQSHDFSIYGNLIYDNGPFAGILIHRAAHDIDIWSNIIYRNQGPGISVYVPSSFKAEARSHDLNIFNNVFAENNLWTESRQRSKSGILIGNGKRYSIKNNIFYRNQPNMTYFRQAFICGAAISTTAMDYNRYYWPGQISRVVWGSKDLTVRELQSAFGQEKNGSDGDPGFVDPGRHNYALRAGSPCLNAGSIISFKDRQGNAVTLGPEMGPGEYSFYKRNKIPPPGPEPELVREERVKKEWKRASPEAIRAYDAKLLARVREEVALGRRVRFSVTAFQQRFEVLSIDGSGSVRLKGPVTEANLEWSRLDILDRRNLAMAVLREENAEDHCLAAFYVIASGDEYGAQDHLLKGGDGAAEVASAFQSADGEGGEQEPKQDARERHQGTRARRARRVPVAGPRPGRVVRTTSWTRPGQDPSPPKADSTPAVELYVKLYLEAETCFVDGDMEGAKKLFERVVREYPATEYAAKAKEYLEIIE